MGETPVQIAKVSVADLARPGIDEVLGEGPERRHLGNRLRLLGLYAGLVTDQYPDRAEPLAAAPQKHTDTADRDERVLGATERRAAVEQTAGALTGVYAPDELAYLREDWPA
jgi:hypothetical protein